MLFIDSSLEGVKMKLSKFKMFGVDYVVIELPRISYLIYKARDFSSAKWSDDLYKLNKKKKLFNWTILSFKSQYKQSYREKDMVGQNRVSLDYQNKPFYVIRWFDDKSG